MTLSFIHVYYSSKPSNGYTVFEKEQGESKKEMEWKIECLRILTVSEETATRVCKSKKNR